MMSCAAVTGLRTAAAFSSGRRTQHYLPAPAGCRRLRVLAAAEEPGKAPAAAEQAAAAPAAEQAKPEQKPTFEEYMQSQPDALGPVGNVLMATLLVVLCFGSVFFTVGRSFQPDLVPLTPEMMEEMQR